MYLTRVGGWNYIFLPDSDVGDGADKNDLVE